MHHIYRRISVWCAAAAVGRWGNYMSICCVYAAWPHWDFQWAASMASSDGSILKPEFSVCVCVGIARMLRSAVQFPAKSSRSSVFRCCPTARDRPANGSPAFKLFTRGSLAELLIVYWRNVEWKLITKIYSLSSVSHYSWLPLLNLIISSTFKSINKANSSAARCSLFTHSLCCCCIPGLLNDTCQLWICIFYDVQHIHFAHFFDLRLG